MIVTAADGLKTYRFPSLDQFAGLEHAVFSRRGGLSRGPWAGLNVSFGTGDRDESVLSNRQLISRHLQDADITYVRQVHGTRVHIMAQHSGRPQPTDDSRVPVADALATDIPGKYLAVQTADCQPVLLYDPKQQVVAAVHSGWRGSVGNIIGHAVSAVEEHFNCRPEDMTAVVGPSLGPCCAEFVNYRTEIPAQYWKYRDRRDHFDFWAISRDQLLSAGIKAQNISLAELCTKCNSHLFYSYRQENETGRFAAVIGLKK